MFEQLWREDRWMLGIVSLPLVHNLADVLCVGKDVVDQPTRVVLTTHGFTGLGREDLGSQAFGVESLCNLQAGLLLGGQLEDSFDQLRFGFVDRESTIDDIESEFGLPTDVLALTRCQKLFVSDAFADIRTGGRCCEEGFTQNSFVRVRTLATKRLNARHREIDRRAFFVSRQEITMICEFFKTGSYDSLRSLFEERFPECECNHQGCA